MIESYAGVSAFASEVFRRSRKTPMSSSRSFAERWKPFGSMARTFRIEADDVTVGGSDAEVLMFEVGQGPGHEKSRGQQDDRQGDLKNHEALLGHG
jgi:hypothetical protein